VSCHDFHCLYHHPINARYELEYIVKHMGIRKGQRVLQVTKKEKKKKTPEITQQSRSSRSHYASSMRLLLGLQP
jgi:hypothetical protein